MWLPLVSAGRLAAGPCDSGSQEARRASEGPVTGAGSFLSVPGSEVKDGTKTTSEGKQTFNSNKRKSLGAEMQTAGLQT